MYCGVELMLSTFLTNCYVIIVCDLKVYYTLCTIRTMKYQITKLLKLPNYQIAKPSPSLAATPTACCGHSARLKVQSSKFT